MPVCLRAASAGGVESIIFSAGSAESLMLSALTESVDTLSTGAKSMIVSAPPAESMIFSRYLVMLLECQQRLQKKQQSVILAIAN